MTLMHSYHGERVSVAEPQEDTSQTLTAESRSEQKQNALLSRLSETNTHQNTCFYIFFKNQK